MRIVTSNSEDSTSDTLSYQTLLDLLKELVKERMLAKPTQQLRSKLLKQFHLAGQEGLNTVEVALTMIALAPHLEPGFYETIIREVYPNGGEFVEIGGVKGIFHRGMLPTGETAQFILGGNDLAHRMEIQELLSEGGNLYKRNIMSLEQVREGEPAMSGRLLLSHKWINKVVFQKESEIRFGPDFPAKRILTPMDWDDVVLHPMTMQQIGDIANWLKFNQELLKDPQMGKRISPGYRVLFYGPPGTGKTLTAAMLGKQFEKEVYRVDLSQVTSKYIGETEKNLEKIFTVAENQSWILFFDEADALFGKRTGVQSSHDKYANQEVSYLLQRVEEFNGLIILASNFKNNLDDAFIRRFHGIVHFPMPSVSERITLWEKTIPKSFKLGKDVNLAKLSEDYELTGASILNIIHYVALKAMSQGKKQLDQAALEEGVRREYAKEERFV